MSSRLNDLRRRRAGAAESLAKVEKRKLGGIAAARRRFVKTTAEVLRAELAARRQGKALVGSALAKPHTLDLFEGARP